MGNHVQAGVRLPREGIARAFQFVFAIDGADIGGHGEMVGCFPLHLGTAAKDPGEIHVGHVFVLSVGLRHGQQRIRIVTTKTRSLHIQVLGTVTETQLGRGSRF